jgi:hypothetical protein
VDGRALVRLDLVHGLDDDGIARPEGRFIGLGSGQRDILVAHADLLEVGRRQHQGQGVGAGRKRDAKRVRILLVGAVAGGLGLQNDLASAAEFHLERPGRIGLIEFEEGVERRFHLARGRRRGGVAEVAVLGLEEEDGIHIGLLGGEDQGLDEGEGDVLPPLAGRQSFLDDRRYFLRDLRFGLGLGRGLAFLSGRRLHGESQHADHDDEREGGRERSGSLHISSSSGYLVSCRFLMSNSRAKPSGWNVRHCRGLIDRACKGLLRLSRFSLRLGNADRRINIANFSVFSMPGIFRRPPGARPRSG